MEGLGIAGLIALRARAVSKERARGEEATSELDSMLGETESVKPDVLSHPVFGHRTRVS
jgi:transcriptional regulator of NAD metabolism